MPNVADLVAPSRSAADAVEAKGTGDAGLTIRKKKEYDSFNIDAQSNGEEVPSWPAWLESQGYSLDGRGLVYRTK